MTKKDDSAQEQGSPVDHHGLEPTHQEIAHLAHQYWLQRGDGDGSPEDDWFRAMEELKARYRRRALAGVHDSTKVVPIDSGSQKE